MHCVDLGESFPTSIYLQNLASIQPRTSRSKFGSQITLLITYRASCRHKGIAEPGDHRPRIAWEGRAFRTAAVEPGVDPSTVIRSRPEPTLSKLASSSSSSFYYSVDILLVAGWHWVLARRRAANGLCLRLQKLQINYFRIFIGAIRSPSTYLPYIYIWFHEHISIATKLIK